MNFSEFGLTVRVYVVVIGQGDIEPRIEFGLLNSSAQCPRRLTRCTVKYCLFFQPYNRIERLKFCMNLVNVSTTIVKYVVRQYVYVISFVGQSWLDCTVQYVDAHINVQYIICRSRAGDPDLHSFSLLDPDPGGQSLRGKTEKMQGKQKTIIILF